MNMPKVSEKMTALYKELVANAEKMTELYTNHEIRVKIILKLICSLQQIDAF